MSQLFDLAALLTAQPVPPGRRVAVVGNSLLLARLAADACASGGLEIAAGYPLILPGDCAPEDVRKAITGVLSEPDVDAVASQFVLPIGASAADLAHHLSEASLGTDKPVVSTFLALDGQRVGEEQRPGRVPLYASPEEAVSALARATAYGEWRRRPEGEMPLLENVDPTAARDLVESELADRSDGLDLSVDSVTGLLAAYGVEVWRSVAANSVDEAVNGAREVGYPVALKATAPSLRHRPDLGAVRLDIDSEEDLREAYDQMTAQLGGPAAALTVQAMAPPGVPTVIRIHEDPAFGALVSFGVGGAATDLLGDRAFRIVPMTDLDAAELIRSVRAAPLLFGYRGSEPVNVKALEQLLLRVGRLADDLPEVAELELNPVVASSAGFSVLQASARLSLPTARLDTGPRRLR